MNDISLPEFIVNFNTYQKWPKQLCRFFKYYGKFGLEGNNNTVELTAEL